MGRKRKWDRFRFTHSLLAQQMAVLPTEITPSESPSGALPVPVLATVHSWHSAIFYLSSLMQLKDKPIAVLDCCGHSREAGDRKRSTITPSQDKSTWASQEGDWPIRCKKRSSTVSPHGGSSSSTHTHSSGSTRQGCSSCEFLDIHSYQGNPASHSSW